MAEAQALKEVEEGFCSTEEDAIISMAIETPRFIAPLLDYLQPEIFTQNEAQFVMALIQALYKQWGYIPSRDVIMAEAQRKLFTDQDYADILALIDRKLQPREIEPVKYRLVEWIQHKILEQMWNERTSSAYEKLDYEPMKKIWKDYERVSSHGGSRIHFFDEVENVIFQEDNAEKFPTGFNRLDQMINEGGLERGECFVWMAPTGKGKSILLCNNTCQSAMKGHKVLHISLEMGEKQVFKRFMGIMTDIPIEHRMKQKEVIMKSIKKYKVTSGNGDIIFIQYPPRTASVNNIISEIDDLRKFENWEADVVIIDYLELLAACERTGDAEHQRQKDVSIDLMRLAKQENVAVFTATQTNRGGYLVNSESKEDRQMISLNNISESYSKSHGMDYIVGLNVRPQSDEEKANQTTKADCVINKNRNGPSEKSVVVNINFNTMKIREISELA